MQFSFEIKDLIYLGSIFLGFITGTVLLIFGFKKKKANILIGLSYLTISYAVFLVFLISSGYHVHFPQLYRTGNIAGLIFAPLSYLYIRQIIEDRPLKLVDILHFVPALIFIIDFFPILFLIPVEEKIALIQSEIDDPAVFVYFNQSRFFPPNFYTYARTLLILAYWVASVFILFRFGKTFEKKKNAFGKEWIVWMKTFLISNLLLFVPFLLLSRIVDSQLGFDLLHFSAAIVILINSIMVLFFPKVLYGLDEFDFILSQEKELQENEKQESHTLTPEKIKTIEKNLHRVIEEEKVFLQNGLTISELAQKAEIPNYLLTIYLNQVIGVSFTDYINKKRVDECCSRIKNGDLQHITLEGLGISCGFNNRNSFISSFKKYMGITPSVFSKSLNG
ncbi:AraC family transcriptional regulator [Algoriphagus kandeliae]|uniref:AraC family transcriptional regulator n=1 Tax=Algoriphagus kandeliae TaxID=2562278 RepID=A0A4Y9R0T5_9BACT|nr:AraC family transcriptional regulator [Algoriphagus kandeliae]TFV97738.1 AraC family transcriptional regulator [Algoriphagus kandeliae]